MVRYIYVLLFVAIFTQLNAQEFNLNISVLTPQLQTADPAIFKALENDLYEFFNNQKWTDDTYNDEERIEGSILITISKELSSTEFVADVTIQSIRPVFNSTYSSKMINYLDKGMTFEYVQNQPIQNSKDKYFDNLSSVMSFYAYTILGFDYDSFSPKGGTKYFRLAQDVMNNVPKNVQSADNSWTENNKKRGRYYIIENLFNPRLKNFRDAWYNYHRQGLDIMYSDDGKGRAVTLAVIRDLESASKNYQNSMLAQMFADSKNSEIVEIFLEADKPTQTRVFNMMVNIDPFRANIYGKLK